MITTLINQIKNRVNKSKTINDIVITFASRVLTALFLFITMILIARYFGAEGKGIFTIFFFLPELIFNLGHLGIGNANIFYIAQDKETSRKIFYNSIVQSVIMSFLLISLFLIFYWINPKIMGELNPIYVYWSLILIPIKFLEKYLRAIFIGNKNFRLFNILLILSEILILISTILFIFVFNLSLVWILLIYTIANTLLALSYLYICIRDYGFSFSFDRYLFKKMVAFGLKSYLVCLFSYLVLRVDIYMLNIMKGLNSVGLYSIATNFFDGMNLLASSTALVLFPLMSEKHTDGYNILKKGLRLVFFAIVPIVILSIVLIKPAVLIIFGKEFLPAVLPFCILSIALIFWSMSTIINQYYASLKFPIFIIWLWLFGLLLNIALNLIFVPKYGIIAAAVSSLITYFLIWLVSFINVKSEHAK